MNLEDACNKAVAEGYAVRIEGTDVIRFTGKVDIEKLRKVEAIMMKEFDKRLHERQSKEREAARRLSGFVIY